MLERLPEHALLSANNVIGKGASEVSRAIRSGISEMSPNSGRPQRGSFIQRSFQATRGNRQSFLHMYF